MGSANLDMDILRSLITAQRLGSFSWAADHLGRSQSAISQQLHKLEEPVGVPHFQMRRASASQGRNVSFFPTYLLRCQIGGRFFFDGDHAELLFNALLAIFHVRDVSKQAAVLRWSLGQLATELELSLPGGALMADHLAQIMLLQVTRLWLGSGEEKHTGWLGALADPRLVRVMGAKHGNPARRWTLAELAGLAGMSRTIFAGRFRDVVRQTPLDYLTGWRMRLATDRLQHSDESIASIGLAVGYESESAFSAAFRRSVGRTPTQHRRLTVA